MLKAKNLYKFAWVIPAIAGLSLMAYAPAVSESQEIKKELQSEKVITVDRSVHDFGTIGEDNGNVSAVFVVTNNTGAPIVLTNVSASCGCTTPSWTKEPIEPGKTGEVTATYSPKGRPGPFDKSITITTSGDPERLVVHIKGTVE
ncbi:MAG: DUF1573 domain-containing protein [Candidatus Symbiothrix sp.]|jgi:hypothetical protein|nr:DUF1573 domain-containing protein [Candidatus Symbiothrix sp.]